TIVERVRGTREGENGEDEPAESDESLSGDQQDTRDVERDNESTMLRLRGGDQTTATMEPPQDPPILGQDSTEHGQDHVTTLKGSSPDDTDVESSETSTTSKVLAGQVVVPTTASSTSSPEDVRQLSTLYS
ncbi:unnamed protein product, partial [Amoebophrya sp. A25]